MPNGLPDDHVLLAIDYVVGNPVLDGAYDPRWVSLTADGVLVHQRWDVEAILGTTATTLDDAGLKRAWAAIARSGVFRDGNLPLPGFMEQHGPPDVHEFRVDDGATSTRLKIASLGSEGVYADDPPVPASELALRSAAARLMEELRSMAGHDRWVPPALLLWWRGELPADWNAAVVPWSVPIDLTSAGHAIDHPVWDRCLRLDGDAAAAVARVAHDLSIDHLVDQGGARFAINVRAIHPDEIDQVECP